ncbi:GMC family oxidoreductase N-terminal domain-containing protein [Variovorax sp. J31P207]|uniref:GMC family oxidoreductase n=1 Tax=Variovorax sp. J31P207 TaxID=3053510 RepID=UPI00257912CD|nr:GMC family oxidoreductase N-terminal domain-containing protein [Variovorax sp. J31P207]MDM0071526.1 GMC family oxidoreductase N-terminal domain-containing protein [Variovorax sp. J31P207]
MPASEKVHDVIVVGGGAAGCALAARLSEDPMLHVLLLEEGPTDNSLFIKMPGGYFKVMGTERTTPHESEPVPGAKNRRIGVMQARTLGGGLSINAMIYIRGQREDYEGWKSDGCAGWGWDDVLPWFKKSEGNSRLSGPLHGTCGPLKVTDTHYRHSLSEAFVRAAQETGEAMGLEMPYNHDFNGTSQLGVGFYQAMIDGGERASTARTYLRAAAGRENLTVLTDAKVSRVLFEGRRAVGVAVQLDGQGEQRLMARREVVLTAGSLISPKLLMLSGVGPGAHLQEHGIDVLVDLPGVGQNYQDHIVAPVDGQLSGPIGLIGQDKGLNALRHGSQWLMFRSGLLSSNLCEAGGFLDLDGDGRAEIQIHVLAAASTSWSASKGMPPVHGLSVAPCLLTSHSRGQIYLRSSNPDDRPRLDANYLSDPSDVVNLVRGVRVARRFLQAPSLAPYIRGEILPGASVGDDEAALEDYVRGHAQNAFHPAGTCAMGIGSDAVVDLELRVRGVEGLRVADASVMPTLIRGNTTAPTVMIAERAADFIHHASR